jgi:signal transduction histidine kinase
MVVSEGSFFAVMLLVVVGLMWRTVRREVELERQHRNFLSAITHELKSPLASMRLSLETVLRGRADQSASVRFLENALQDTERLQSLVQKVLEVTRYGQSGGAVTLTRSCLTEVVEDTLATFGRRASVAGIRVNRDLQPEVWVDLDAEAFTIVLSNLLENGVKYGGAVPALGVRLAMEGADAVLDVSDNGKGIPAEEVPFVFNRFFRGGDEMTRTTQGTGLGLYLVRQIVSAHHGTVEVLRTGPAGTVFRVRLPDAEVWEESA